jgi:phage-related minor tail protein
MALAETARLAVELALTDKLTPGLKTADASLAGLTKSTAVQTKALTGLGDKQTRFTKLAGVAGTAFKAMGGVASAGFALATQGAIELEDAQVDIQRETGLTADAARDAAKAINGIAGRNVSDIKTVSAAFEKVHNDLGLTGQAALDVTEQFVEFGRATKQGPAEAVSAFDDILDSFGITADHSGEIMDKLVASHQKYGGAIDANEAALAGMAPQLKALNLNIDDGIGLLNLFASSGLDAAGAQKALNTAITKLPAGTSLNDFIAHLSTITDDGQRAQEAMRVFGTKAGAGLANAIKPGINSLDSFKVSTQEAAGATKKASDVIDSSLRGKLEKALSELKANLRGFGQDFGPLLTGLGSVASLGASLGGGGIAKNLAEAIGPPIVKALKNVGQQAGSAISDGISAVMSGAEGTVLGNFVASRIEAIADPTKSTVIGNTWRAVAGKAALLYSVTFAAGVKIADALTGVISGLPGAAGVGTALDKAGTLMGGRLGFAIKLGLVAGVAGLADAMLPEVEKAGQSLHHALSLPDIDINPANLPWPLGNKGAPDWAQIKHDTSQGSADVGNAIVTGINGVTGTVQSVMGQYEAAVAKAGTASEETATVITHAFGPVGPEVQARMKMALAGVANFSNKSGGIIKEWRTEFAAGLKGGIGAVRQAREGIDGQFDQLMEDLKSFASRGKRIGHDIGQLTSKALQQALHSGNPLIRAEAREVQLNYLTELSTLVRKGHGIGVKGMEALHDGLKSKEGRVRAAARQILDTIDGQIDKPAVGRNAGSHIGGSLASSLRGKSGTVAGAARHIADVIRANLPRTISTTINVRVRTSDSTIGGRAGGGIIAPGQIVLVGEQGPEIGIGLAGGGARIISNQQSLPLLSAMAGLTGALSQRPTPTSPSSIRLPQRSEPKAKYPEFISVNVRAEVTSNSVNKAQYTSKRFGANPDLRI